MIFLHGSIELVELYKTIYIKKKVLRQKCEKLHQKCKKNTTSKMSKTRVSDTAEVVVFTFLSQKSC